MKILFIGARLFDDVALYTRKKSITSVVSESNPESPNLELADSFHIVSRGMEMPMEIAIDEDVDGVVPLIGIDNPLLEVAAMKEKLENEHGIPVVASGVRATTVCADKFMTKQFFRDSDIDTPEFFKISRKNYDNTFKSQDKFPAVLKQPKGQGGSGVNIINSKEGLDKYFLEYETAFAEKFVEGTEISIEVLKWNNKIVPLVPVYKGKTTLEGVHPLKKIKKAPLEIEGIDNSRNITEIKKLAVKIAENMDLEGTADIDIIYDPETGKNYVIEVNARPSGTRYVTWAASDVNVMQELVDMAANTWNASKLKNRIKNYSAIEIPVGNYSTDKNNYMYREFTDENSWIIHGPENHERITIRGKTIEDTIETARELKIWDEKKF